MQDYPYLPLDLQNAGNTVSVDYSTPYEQVLGSFSLEADIQHIKDHFGEDSLEGLNDQEIHELAISDRVSAFEDSMQSGDIEAAQDLIEGAGASPLGNFFDDFDDGKMDL